MNGISLLGEEFTLVQVVQIAGTLVLAGFIKGGLGFGMPVVAVSLVAAFVDVRLAVTLMIFPIVASNLWVGCEGGQFRSIAKHYWIVILTMCVGIFIGSRLLLDLDQDMVLLILGLFVAAFAASELLKARWRLTIPPHRYREYGFGTGMIGGLVGGLTTVFGPPLVMYLTALRVPRDMFVRANSVISFFAAVALVLAFSSVRLLTVETAVLSLLCLVPAFLGVYLGRALRERIRQDLFETAASVGIFLLGANLVRRSLIG